jgi:hypothetical protein
MFGSKYCSMLMPEFTYGAAILIRTPLAEVSGLHLYISRYFHGDPFVLGFGDSYESPLSTRSGSSFVLQTNHLFRVKGSLLKGSPLFSAQVFVRITLRFPLCSFCHSSFSLTRVFAMRDPSMVTSSLRGHIGQHISGPKQYSAPQAFAAILDPTAYHRIPVTA